MFRQVVGTKRFHVIAEPVEIFTLKILFQSQGSASVAVHHKFKCWRFSGSLRQVKHA